MMKSIESVIAVSTYPPRQCGIATFTKNLFEPFISNGKDVPQVKIVAISSDTGWYHNYPDEVLFEIRSSYISDYKRAAEFVNLSNVDVISLQHEFGIFGGEAGEYILQFLTDLKKPIVTTLHTILPKRDDPYFRVLKEVCNLSSLVVVQCKKGIEFLTEIYNISPEKIRLIYHGAPDIPFLDPYLYKDKFNATNRTVLLTFGLISRNKGIENVLESLPAVVKEFPDVLYIILGKTHPEVLKKEGEQYRHFLQNRVQKLGIEENVVFYDYFVTDAELIQFLTAADIFVTPYLSEEQIVSGTLTYAMACGKAIISTPYHYAKEMLSEGRGYLVPFNNPSALAQAILDLLRNPSKLNELRKESYQFGRQLVQRKVSERYLEVFKEAINSYKQPKRTSTFLISSKFHSSELPEVNLEHLYTLTDDTGILQHAHYTVPDRAHGYTLDDNARALIVVYQNWSIFGNKNILAFMNRYLSFIYSAFDREKNTFRNFMGYDRKFIEEKGSEDSHSRAMWSLSGIIKNPPSNSILILSSEIFKLAASRLYSFTSPRAWAYGLIACCKYLERFGGDVDIKEIVTMLILRFDELYKQVSDEHWPWPEEIVSYDNGRIPQALILAGRRLQDKRLINQGLKSLEWLIEIQKNNNANCLSLIGNNGWLKKGETKADFDQQPIEIPALIDACLEAYYVSKDKKWLKEIYSCFQWFMGRNDLNEVLYDSATGGCYDGLTPKGVNQNQGAESTLAFLMALHTLYQIEHLNLDNSRKQIN